MDNPNVLPKPQKIDWKQYRYDDPYDFGEVEVTIEPEEVWSNDEYETTSWSVRVSGVTPDGTELDGYETYEGNQNQFHGPDYLDILALLSSFGYDAWSREERLEYYEREKLKAMWDLYYASGRLESARNQIALWQARLDEFVRVPDSLVEQLKSTFS